MQQPQALVQGILAGDVHQQIKGVRLQQRSGRSAASTDIYGTVPDVFVVEEQGLRFEVQPGVHHCMQ